MATSSQRMTDAVRALLPRTFEVDAIQTMKHTEDRRLLMAALLDDVGAITTTPGAVATLRDAIRSPPPCSTTPEALKDRGNAAFKAKHFKEAIAAFSEGLRLLTIDDEPRAQLQSILFTNRCAAWHALGALEHAFADATRAITSYPPYPKAWFRRAKILEACVTTDTALAATLCASLRPEVEPLALVRDDLAMAKALVETPSDVDPFEKAALDLPPHLDTATYAHPPYHKHVRVVTSMHAGRYLEATHPLPAGTVVLVEDPVASAGLDPIARCENCFAACENLVPCDACAYVVYCSDACRATATEWHHTLCATNLDCPSRLLLRLALQFRTETAVRTSDDVRPWGHEDVYDLKRLLHRAPLPTRIARTVPALIAAMQMWAVDGSCHALCHNGRVHGYVYVSTVAAECIVTLYCEEACPSAPSTWLQGVVSLVAHKQQHVTLRSTSRVLLDALQSDTETWVQLTPNEYRFRGHRHEELVTLADDVDMVSPTTLVTRVLYAAALAAVLRPDSVSTMDEMAGRLLSAASRVTINQVAITTTTSSTAQGTVDVVGQARLGTGLFPAMAMCNHSCAPNASVHFTGRTLYLVTTRAVAQGDEIAISYGPHRAKMRTTERQQILNEQYGFACHCAACRDPPPTETDETLSCFLAASKRAADGIHRRLAHGDDAAALHTQIDTLVDARVASLPPNHLAIAEALDLRAQLLAMHGAFAAASDACLEAIAVLETHYDPLDAELGHEYIKAAQLLFNAERWSSCRVYLGRAMRSLTLHLPATDALFAEMAEMQAYVASRT